MNNLPEEELEFIHKTKEKIESMNLFTQPNWAKEDKEYLISNYKSKNFTEIAKELNRSSSSVRDMASPLDLKRKEK